MINQRYSVSFSSSEERTAWSITREKTQKSIEKLRDTILFLLMLSIPVEKSVGNLENSSINILDLKRINVQMEKKSPYLFS